MLLTSRIVVGQPCTPDVAAHVKDGVIDDVLHVWEAVLEFVRHEKT